MTFDEIYTTYGKRVLNLAFRLVGDEEAARDLTQDVFLKVYQNLSEFNHRSQIYTWIYRIAINHFINYLKREKKRRWLLIMDNNIIDLVTSNNASQLFSYPPQPDHLIEKSERDNIVLALVNSLPLKYRVPLVLQRYDGMSTKEIATTLNLTVSAVETRIHRAKQKLIKKLEPWLKHLK